MAFPDIPTVGAGRVLTGVQANATSPRTFPNLSSLTKNAGDLLLAIIAVYQSSTVPCFSSWGGSFTELEDIGTATNMSIGIAYKFSNGTETGTFTVAQGTTITGHAAMILLSISGAHPTTPPSVGSIASGTTSMANAGALVPAGGIDDYLWISVAGIGETSTSGTFTGLSASPSGYSGDVKSAISGDVVGGVQVGVGFEQLRTTTEDPGTWTGDVSNARNVAALMAVRPAPPLQQPFTVKPQNWNWL